MLQRPIKKSDKFISHLHDTVKHFLSDIKIKSMHKFVDNKGYLITIYIPESVNNDIIHNLIDFDNDVIHNIKKQSPEWFNKTFTEQDVLELYTKSYCIQTHTIDVILSHNYHTKISLNNTYVDSFDDILDLIKDLKHLKKCMINLEIQHAGLYFYQESATNKWIIKSLDITDTTKDTCSFSKEDIKDKLEDNISKLNMKTAAKIQVIDMNKAGLLSHQKLIEDTYKELKSSSGKKWEETLDKLNVLILGQEDKIKSM